MNEVHRESAECFCVDVCKNHVSAVPFVYLVLECLHKVVCELSVIFFLHLMNRDDRVHCAARNRSLEAVRELHHETHCTSAAA